MDRVRVRLSVRLSEDSDEHAMLKHGKYFLAVTDPRAHIGFWDFNRARRLSLSSFDTWSAVLWISKNSHFIYKYMIVQNSTKKVVHCEDINVRNVKVGFTSILLEDTYNNVDFADTVKMSLSDHKTSRSTSFGSRIPMYKSKKVRARRIQTKKRVRHTSSCEVITTIISYSGKSHNLISDQYLANTTLTSNSEDDRNEMSSTISEVDQPSNDLAGASVLTPEDTDDMQYCVPIVDSQVDIIKDPIQECQYIKFVKVVIEIGLAAVAVIGLYKGLRKTF